MQGLFKQRPSIVGACKTPVLLYVSEGRGLDTAYLTLPNFVSIKLG